MQDSDKVYYTKKNYTKLKIYTVCIRPGSPCSFYSLAKIFCQNIAYPPIITFNSNDLLHNSTARKLPIQKCMGKIAVQLKSHGESEIARN